MSEIEHTVEELQDRLPAPTGYYLKQRRAQAVREICGRVMRRTGGQPQARTPLLRILPFALLAIALFFVGYKFTDLLLAVVQTMVARDFSLLWVRWTGSSSCRMT